MKSVAPRTLTFGLVTGLAFAGLVAGVVVWASTTGDAEDIPKAEPPPLSVINAENSKSKFEGEVHGVFIASRGVPVPDKFLTHEELCGSQLTTEVSWDEAGGFDIDLVLPEPYKLDEQSLNTGTIACGETVYAARWAYTAAMPSGYAGSMVIARSAFKHEEFDVSADRVAAKEIGGLPAVWIAPLSPSGVSSAAGVVFPGEFVTTSIYSSGVPETDLLEIAELVAGAIKVADS